MEVGYLLKCILVVLVFFGLAFLVKIIVGVRAKRRSVWGRALELALQVGPQLRKPTIGNPHLACRAMAEVRETTKLKRLL